jgi:hypothetical protein
MRADLRATSAATASRPAWASADIAGGLLAQVAPSEAHCGDGGEHDRGRAEDREAGEVDSVADRVVS